jgi:phage protein D
MANTEQPRKSSLKLFYNGVNATTEFSLKTESFTYVDTASGEADTLTLTVNNQTGDWLEGFLPEDGDYIEASIYVENWDSEGDNRSLSCGKFDLDDFGASGFPETASISGITIPIKTNFNTTEKNEIYSKITTKAILSKICSNAGISLSYESEDFTVEEIEQSRQTDMNFAFSLCKTYNLAMKLYDNKMVVYDQTAYEKKDAAYTIDKSDMQNYSYKRAKTRLYDSVQIQYANPNSDETLTYSYTIPGGKGIRTLYLNEQADSYRDAEIKAKSRLIENIRDANTLTFRIKGDTKHISARNINVTGLKKADGKYFVDRVTHSKSAKGIYTCTIKAHLVVTHTDVSVPLPPPKEEAAPGTTYTVVKGDCLWNIAKKFYGSGAKYTIIFNANRGIIKNPSLIYPGQVLTIPPG